VVKVSDLSFKSDHLEIHIRDRKTDQLRQGNLVLVASTLNEFCPVAVLETFVLLQQSTT
jgi:hypothetical protein